MNGAGNLNRDMWQGQTLGVSYIEQRCHYTFLWWHEYSGGQMTDLEGHHLDIAQWGINSLSIMIASTAKYPSVKDGFNIAVDYWAKYVFENGVEMTVSDHGRNGIMFSGTGGRVFVNRGVVSGKLVEGLAKNPLSCEKFSAYDYDNLHRAERSGKRDAIINQMGNFFRPHWIQKEVNLGCRKSTPKRIDMPPRKHFDATRPFVEVGSTETGVP